MSSKNIDRLSILPEEIISQILSLMPTIFAVRTNVLSKRWRYSWMFVTNLIFDDIHPIRGLDSFTKLVDGALNFCKTSQVEFFRLHFKGTCAQKSSVSNWIDKAVALNVREVDLQLDLGELPLSLFTCKTLTKLRLDLRYLDYNVWKCIPRINLPCVKTLDIIVYTNPFVDVHRLINGCPMLESLSIELAWQWHSYEEEYLFNVPTLKQLKVTWPNFCARCINKVVLRVPNLEYLFFDGVLSANFVMEDVSSLVEASLSFHEIISNHFWVELLKGLSGVKSLSVQKIPSGLLLPSFPNMKYLELKSFRHPGPIVEFLESCRELKHLYFEETQVLADFHWIKPKLVPACMLTNLTTFKFSISKWWIWNIDFMEYMLGNAEVLKKVTITWKYSSNIEEETRLCAKLLTIRKASKCCEIHFHGNWTHYTSS